MLKGIAAWVAQAGAKKCTGRWNCAEMLALTRADSIHKPTLSKSTPEWKLPLALASD